MSEPGKRKKITIYADGACSGNPGPGGFGVILCYNGHEKVVSGGEPGTTNNRMELRGAIAGLEQLKEPCDVTLYTDSQYVVNGITKGWAEKWRQNGWMRNKKESAQNPDLWERLLELCGSHRVEFVWVRGHADNEYNNRCDRIAVAECEKYKK